LALLIGVKKSILLVKILLQQSGTFSQRALMDHWQVNAENAD